ncbi:MAG: glycine cleavage system protein GcvH [Gammaproteobacteria bacterium]|nr:glycine cleavage system protein GcvH [Gammaproteobacteria bacterium]
MSEIPDDLKYTVDHEWLRVEDDGSITVGITDHAQEALGELVFVELPDEGQSCNKGDACAVVESVKAASDVYSPLTGSVTDVNDDLADEPELVNTNPYEAGWLFSIVPDSEDQLEHLMDTVAYEEYLSSLED